MNHVIGGTPISSRDLIVTGSKQLAASSHFGVQVRGFENTLNLGLGILPSLSSVLPAI